MSENILNNPIKQVTFEVKPGTAYDSSIKYLAQRDQEQVNLEYAALMNSHKSDDNAVLRDVISQLNVPHTVKREYRYALISGGKDSVSMMEIIMQNPEEYPCDAAVFIDTQCEFPIMYRNAIRCLERFEAWGKETGKEVEVMILYPKLGFWDIFESGYGRGTGTSRNASISTNRMFCRRILRTDVVANFHKILNDKGYNRIIQYVGRTASDGKGTTDFARTWTKNAQKSPMMIDMRYPLIECGSDTTQNLIISARAGYDYEGFYNDFEHGFCFACPQTSIKHWRTLWAKYPSIWEFMKKKFSLFPHIIALARTDYTLADLERRFIFEVEYVQRHHELTYETVCKRGFNDKRFLIALYLTLGAYNPVWQQKANELLVKKRENYSTDFFQDDSSTDEIPIVVYNIVSGVETYYKDLHEFASSVEILPTEVREYCDRSLQPEYTNSERLLRGIFLCRYTWGNEYVPHDGPVIPALALYGWILDNEEKEERIQEAMEEKEQSSGIKAINTYNAKNSIDLLELEVTTNNFLEERAKVIAQLDEEQKARMDTIADLEHAFDIQTNKQR